MKLPNGYGTVYKLSGKRRNPWIARKTTGWAVDNDKVKQQYLTIGYYSSRSEALQALALFNENPYNLDMSRHTFADIYSKWFDDTFDDNSNRSTVKNYNSAYNFCSSLYELRMTDIRPFQMQKVIEDAGNNYNLQRRILTLFCKLYEWCINHDCLKKNYAQQVKLTAKNEPASERKAFSRKEVELLWAAVNQNEYIKLVLMLIYSGVRVSELLDLKKTDVHLEEQYFYVKESKTESGIRVVPIADKVLPFWKEFIQKSECEYAVCSVTGARLTYENFKSRYWKPIMQELNLTHTIHETRHTFISKMVAANVNMTIIKKIVGHKSIMNLTEKIYTHIEIEELLAAVNSL